MLKSVSESCYCCLSCEGEKNVMSDCAEELDVSGLSLHQAKRLEMEAQVRVLELESGLEKERLKLSALRRHHYQLAGETDESPTL